MSKKTRFITLAVLALDFLFLIYVMGPKVENPTFDKVLPELTVSLSDLDGFIASNESKWDIKPDNASRIVWADSVGQKAPYSVVYLHGWSASAEEGNPVHRKIAADLGANLYLPRLSHHGLVGDDVLLDITADSLVDSAKEALSIARMLGDQVIIMATSNGGALGLYLAESVPELAALVLYSPNIEIYDPTAKLLDDPWGLQIAKAVKGSNYNTIEMPETRKPFWYSKYRLESLPHLQAFVAKSMTIPTFNSIDEPVFLGYYYKNEEEQDKVVSVPAMLEMFDALGTPDRLKQKLAFPEAGDHILASPLASKDSDGVYLATRAFLREVVGISIGEDETQ